MPATAAAMGAKSRLTNKEDLQRRASYAYCNARIPPRIPYDIIYCNARIPPRIPYDIIYCNAHIPPRIPYDTRVEAPRVLSQWILLQDAEVLVFS